MDNVSFEKFQETHNILSCVVLSKSFIELPGGERQLKVKYIDMSMLKSSPTGTEKLNTYAQEGRLGYLDTSHKLHLHTRKCEILKQDPVSKIVAFKNAPQEEIAGFETIEMEEYQELCEELQKQLRLATEHNAQDSTVESLIPTVRMILSAPNAFISQIIDAIEEGHKAEAIRNMLSAWIEQVRTNDAHAREADAAKLLKIMMKNDTILRKAILDWDIKQTNIKQESIEKSDEAASQRR